MSFCSNRETIFHVFTNCCRLRPLFLAISNVFRSCNENFYLETFILGFKYVRKKIFVCQCNKVQNRMKDKEVRGGEQKVSFNDFLTKQTK